MVNPQAENGHTRIANEIMENMAKLPLNGTQFRILMVIWRYTYGFNRKEHDLSLSFLKEATNCDPRQLQRELKNLENRNVITQNIKHGANRIISFQKHYDKWVYDKSIGESTNGESTKSTIGESTKKSIGEFTNQERNKTKLKSNRAENLNTTLINFFRDEYKKRFDVAYLPNWGADGKIIKDFIDAEYTEDYIKSYIKWFLNNDDPFLKKSGYKITLLKTSLTKYQAIMAKPKDQYRESG